MKNKTNADKAKEALTRSKEPQRETLKLSTGCSLLNLACTGNVNSGFLSGHYYRFVGDSASGKTFFVLTCLAEASLNTKFDEYNFVYDNAEDGALMDIRKFFGRRVEERIQPPARDEQEVPLFSRTIEELYYHVDDWIQKDEPFIYILDSMDALSSDAEIDKFYEHKRAHRKGKEAAGSYGDGKAKINSSGIRQIVSKLSETGSILIVISQTRDNLGFGFETKTNSGGRALKFYATLEIWSSCGEKIKKTAMGKPRTIGMECILQVKKNRVTGRDRTIHVPILYELGIDDVGGIVRWLVKEEHWAAKGGKIAVPEFDFKGSEAQLLKHIESEGLEKDLRDIAQEVWDEIELACNPGRKARYE
jgi:RecA/RadA recombinase